MSNPQVRVLLDVDGVLNVMGSGGSWTDIKRTKAKGYRIAWSPAMCARLVSLIDRDGIEVNWLTTWSRWANRHIGRRLDLPQFRVPGHPPDDEDPDAEWWKLTVARSLYERDLTPFVWLDDDLAWKPGIGAQQWLTELPARTHLAIAPPEGVGIQPAHLDAVEAFLATILDPVNK